VDHSQSTQRLELATVDVSLIPTSLQLVQRGLGWVGLLANGLFLCSESDGRITLSRQVCDGWERFVIPDLITLDETAPKTVLSNVGEAARQTSQERKLTIVDVGAAGGLQQSWKGLEDSVNAVMFEPNPEKADDLRAAHNHFFNTIVVQAGLGATPDVMTLNLARQPLCSSLLLPNSDFLQTYSIGPAFDVVGAIDVRVTSYFQLYQNGDVPKPDVIKIDTQGFEYEILEGFGSLLDDCLGVQLETHIYPIYENQHLFHDLTGLLAKHGLILRRISPVNHFDGDIVELDAWYTPSRMRADHLDALDTWKLSLIRNEWALPKQLQQFRF
jgi:FkbM family methyltransferase